MKNELGARIMKEFVETRAKTYSHEDNKIKTIKIKNQKTQKSVS